MEARPSLTKELASNSSNSSEQHKFQQLSLNERSNNKATSVCQKNNSGKPAQKVQKVQKSVRICEPKRSEVEFALPSAVSMQIHQPPQEQLQAEAVLSNGFVSSGANHRPRSVTDALFAAAPVANSGNQNQNHNDNPILPPHSAEDMNKGFMPFADEDPDLISEYSLGEEEEEQERDAQRKPVNLRRGGQMRSNRW